MEQLNNYKLDAIITFKTKEKQPNEDSIVNILTSKIESLTKAKFDSQLNYGTTQLAFTYSKSTIETLQRGVKFT